MKVAISTVPFGEQNRRPIEMLEKAGVEYIINPIGRRLTEDEITTLIKDCDILIAGTEPITENVLRRANRLRLISRVGIGLDSVDLLSAERLGIFVSYTPDAPSPAVAELTVGLMVSLLRSIHLTNTDMHRGDWRRYFGRCLSECVVGIIGTGRIGSKVARLVSSLGCKKVIINDLDRSAALDIKDCSEWQNKETIFREADIISLHVPLTSITKCMVTTKQLKMMKKGAFLVNTARGGIINEEDLFDTLKRGHLAGAAVDVFDNEPYTGPLASIERCLLTAHIGSMSFECRAQMEIEATEEAVRYMSGEVLTHLVPKEEYEIRRVDEQGELKPNG